MMIVCAIMAGLLPIMWSHGTRAEVMQRIAVPMIGGMVSSTLLTPIVIPAIYAVVKGVSLAGARRWLRVPEQSARKEYDDEIQRERDLTMTSLADVHRRTLPNDITESSRAMTRKIVCAANILLFAASFFGVGIGLPGPGRAHEFHGNFSAGEPGDPKKPARVVNVKMFEGSGKMGFEPARIEVRKGEQVRFVLQNKGEEDHEFVLATVLDNRKHAEVMKNHADMEHADPNARRVLPYGNGELVWKFTKRGEFEFACLIPGHYEKGMFGKVIVK